MLITVYKEPAVIETSHETLPKFGGFWLGSCRSSINIPGWSTYVKPHRDNSIYWGNIWKKYGRPTEGWIHAIYVSARKQYHSAVLMVKRRRREIQAQNLLVASMEGDIHLLKEMRAVKQGVNSGNRELPDNVNGEVGEDNIAELFKHSYEGLYNSSPSVVEMDKLLNVVKSNIDATSKVEIRKVNGLIVKEAINKLKPRKTDVTGSYVSDALKHAPDILYDQLAEVFRS